MPSAASTFARPRVGVAPTGISIAPNPAIECDVTHICRDCARVACTCGAETCDATRRLGSRHLPFAIGVPSGIESEGMLLRNTRWPAMIAICSNCRPRKSPPGLADGVDFMSLESVTDLEIPLHPRENLAIGAPYMARR